jgi:nicotinamide-nucleotide amidase
MGMATDRALIAVDEALVDRAIALGDALRARAWRLATAESCTGGLVSGACTAPAGASDWFEAGFVTYGNAAKHALLGVPPEAIRRHGAVSGEVAEAMARGAVAAADVQLALAVTGIAGPAGGSADKPVGTVWLGLAWRHERDAPEGLPAGGEPPRVDAWTQRLQLQGDRAAIRAQTVATALDRLLAVARGEALP